MTRSPTRWTWPFAMAILCHAQVMVVPAKAFDTGHHHDLTASAMKSLGFKSHAIKIAQLENWLVDYYSSQPLAGLEGDLKKLHFDNLEDAASIRAYWTRLKINSKAAMEKAAAEKDSLKIVALLGMSLHAVQDFYSHSDWVEQHPVSKDGYFTDSYFDNAALASGALRTGRYPNHLPLQNSDHGAGAGDTAGMNHDAYTRPRWDRAYVHAFCASRQWIAAARAWVEGVPGGKAVWSKALDLSLSDDDLRSLDRDLVAGYRISEYAPGGHWKGPGSASNLEFLSAVAAFARSPDSPFIEHFTKLQWHKQLTIDLEQKAPVSSDPPIPSIAHPFVAILVRTIQVSELPVGALETKIDPGGKADFYANITMDGQLFTESMQLNSESQSPSWTSIAFVSTEQTSVDIRYELWDEDGAAKRKDDQCDIAAGADQQSLSLVFRLSDETISGDLSGLHNTFAKAAQSSGQLPGRNRAQVKLVISKQSLTP